MYYVISRTNVFHLKIYCMHAFSMYVYTADDVVVLKHKGNILNQVHPVVLARKRYILEHMAANECR